MTGRNSFRLKMNWLLLMLFSSQEDCNGYMCLSVVPGSRSGLGLEAPDQQLTDPDPRPRSEEPDSALKQPRAPAPPPAKQPHEHMVSVQNRTPPREDSPPQERGPR